MLIGLFIDCYLLLVVPKCVAGYSFFLVAQRTFPFHLIQLPLLAASKLMHNLIQDQLQLQIVFQHRHFRPGRLQADVDGMAEALWRGVGDDAVAAGEWKGKVDFKERLHTEKVRSLLS